MTNFDNVGTSYCKHLTRFLIADSLHMDIFIFLVLNGRVYAPLCLSFFVCYRSYRSCVKVVFS